MRQYRSSHLVATVVIKPRRAKPFYFRHPWVFSGAIERIEGDFAEGDLVDVADADGKFIGRGFINSRSQIVVRLLTWDRDEPVDRGFFERRVAAARALREDVLGLAGPDDACRLIFSESDGLPGLIVDRYGAWLVIQVASVGMSLRLEMVLDVLEQALHPAGIYRRTIEGAAEREGLPVVNAVARGQEPPDAIRVKIDGLDFLANVKHGQKTGLYLDQRANRRVVARLASGRSVFDGFTYTGGFAMAAVRGGAKSVVAVDSSPQAIEAGRRNAELNGLASIEFVQADVIETLRGHARSGRRFDLVILDPPKLARSSAHVRRASARYRELNAAALRGLGEGGLLVTFSCSQHVHEDAFESFVNEAACEAGRVVQTLERLGQAPDHPVIASCPETRYLKGLVCRSL
jgi:23S rRNA (cytosine1962-C5)-methyltransferase